MKKRTTMLALLLATGAGTCLQAQEKLTQFKVRDAITVRTPIMNDSINPKGEKYADKDLLKTPVVLDLADAPFQVLSTDTAGVLSFPKAEKDHSIYLLETSLRAERFMTGKLKVTSPARWEIFINGESKMSKENTEDSISGASTREVNLRLEPEADYEITIKLLSGSKDKAVPTLKCELIKDDKFKDITCFVSPEQKKRFALPNTVYGNRVIGVSISPDGKYLLTRYWNNHSLKRSYTYTTLSELKTGKVLLSNAKEGMRWMPKSNLAYYTRKGMKGTELVTLDPTSKKENILACQLPEGSFSFGPTEDYLLFSIREKGPQERKEIQEILVPDDRQPGWRNRMFIHKYDLRTGLFQRLTYGHTSTYINDISQDGHYLLFSRREPNLTERPFSRTYIYKMDLRTMHVDTLIKGEKFVSRAVFSPDATQLLVDASGEAFDGIGLKIKEGQTSNTSDGQLFLYNIADKSIKPLTKNFDPSVDSYEWNALDKQIYITAKDKDRVRMYSLNPSNGKIKQLQAKEDVISDYSIANQAFEMVYFGLSASNSQRLYTYNLKNDASSCLIDLSKEILKDVTLGEVQDWNFVSAQGDTIYGRFYLPPHFDATKKYPMIVNYYGGTTPTARVMESRYPSHVYAGLGYIVYIIQPSGATGFGQEFSARHVNAWGKLTADEIIEGTKKFCEEHPFVNTKKIGCMGASYGGFMTQYLQTKTDIFAAAMSHAGISDITSYWGEGYWGYSYSSLASANSYPWNARDMYTLQSPLFNADKINTPILFLHGTADTNVPIGESIQMFTALKLLGKPTAFVQVEGENHHILDYDKRILWNNTIYAWFAKWLKDQPEWWDALYPPKSL